MKTEYFEISEIFLWLIWRVSTIMTEYFEIGGIFRQFLTHAKEFSDHFPSAFWQLIKIKSSTTWARSFVLQGCNLLLYHCATLTLYIWWSFSLNFFFVITLIIFVINVSSICQQCVYLSQYSVQFRQYCVKLRHYCDFLVSAAFSLLNTLFSFVITLFTFVNTAFVFVSTVLYFVIILCFSSSELC
jgi:hypothetical protein